MNSKEQSQGSNSLFSSRQVVHGSEPLPRSYTVIVDAIQIRFLWVFWAQESLQESDALIVKGCALMHYIQNLKVLQNLWLYWMCTGSEFIKVFVKNKHWSIPGHCCCVTELCRSHRCWWPQTQNSYWNDQISPSWSVRKPAWPSWLSYERPQTLWEQQKQNHEITQRITISSVRKAL